MEAILDGRALNNPSLLNQFHVIAFSDLKKYKFYYWFAFPAIPTTWIVEESEEGVGGMGHVVDHRESEELNRAIQEWREGTKKEEWGFFLVKKLERIDNISTAGDTENIPSAASPFSYAVGSIKDHESFWKDVPKDQRKVGFADPSTVPEVPGWPLRNFLVLLSLVFNISKTSILAYRDNPTARTGGNSPKSFWIKVNSIEIPGSELVNTPDATLLDSISLTKVTGWERNSSNKLVPKISDLGALINPNQLADQAVDLNLKLMKWRIAPSLNLEVIKNNSCLLLGAGTLGSYIARGLLGWGVRKITFVDSGRVSFSNPVRQPLYTFKDCLDGGAPKAARAAQALKEIYPSVESQGYQIEIPMAGHPITNEERQKNDYDQLIKLMEEHDTIFLLMDSRESRWLPTVIASAMNKLVINVALGFDSYAVMRHGISPSSDVHSPHLGCYFCNDVVTPIDVSTLCWFSYMGM